MAGLPFDAFGRHTLREVDAIFRAINTRKARALKERKAEIYTLAALIGTASNNPKKFPKAHEFMREGGAGPRFARDREIAAYFHARLAAQSQGPKSHGGQTSRKTDRHSRCR